MQNEPTTEEIFDGLGSEARAEALRLAARLQAEENESAHIVAAAREAGIEDRYLRMAAGQLRTKKTVRAAFPMTLAVIPALLFFFAQGYAGAVTYGDVNGANLWIPMFLAAFLGASLPRRRWLAPLAVIATWIVVSIFYGVLCSVTGRGYPEMAGVYACRIAVTEIVLAYFGALLARALTKAAPLARDRQSEQARTI